jgi:hypothetical protein
MVDNAGQNNEWTFSLDGCKLSFGVPSESAPFPEYAEGVWVSYLAVDFPDGSQAIFGERFVKPE